MLIDYTVLDQIQIIETAKSVLQCYSCGLEAEYKGGLCAECLFERKINTD